MLRLTVVALGIAVALGACKGGEQRAARGDSAMGEVADSSAARANSAVTGATSSAAGAMDTMRRNADTTAGNMRRQADTAAAKMGREADTLANKAKSEAGKAASAVGATASSAEIRTKLIALSHDQVKQLQSALNDNGCNVGQPDGSVGSKTVDGVKCGLQKYNIKGNDLDALYKALNLNFGS